MSLTAWGIQLLRSLVVRQRAEQIGWGGCIYSCLSEIFLIGRGYIGERCQKCWPITTTVRISQERYFLSCKCRMYKFVGLLAEVCTECSSAAETQEK